MAVVFSIYSYKHNSGYYNNSHSGSVKESVTYETYTATNYLHSYSEMQNYIPLQH